MLNNIASAHNTPREFARESYTIKQKRITIRAVEAFLSSGVSLKEACDLASIEKRVFYRWKNTISELKNDAKNIAVFAVEDMPVDDVATPDNPLVPPVVFPPVAVPMTVAKTMGNARSLNTGWVSILAPRKM